MNLAELNERFDAFVAAVAKRISDGDRIHPPQDPAAVLRPLPAQFKLQAMTALQHPPLYFAVDLRETLQRDLGIDELADRFVSQWRDQVKADDSV